MLDALAQENEQPIQERRDIHWIISDVKAKDPAAVRVPVRVGVVDGGHPASRRADGVGGERVPMSPVGGAAARVAGGLDLEALQPEIRIAIEGIPQSDEDRPERNERSWRVGL